MWITILEVTLLLIGTVAGWVMTVVGLPGNWVIVGGAVVYALIVPADQRLGMSWYVVAALGTVALAGEIFEFIASALGVSRVGGSRRAAALALGGSIIGGIVGIFV